MGYYDVRNAKISILDMLKYDAIQDADGVICKDMGRYVQMLVPTNNAKGHDLMMCILPLMGGLRKSAGILEILASQILNTIFNRTQYKKRRLTTAAVCHIGRRAAYGHDLLQEAQNQQGRNHRAVLERAV